MEILSPEEKSTLEQKLFSLRKEIADLRKELNAVDEQKEAAFEAKSKLGKDIVNRISVVRSSKTKRRYQ